MKCFWSILFCLSGLCQDPAVLAQYSIFTSNDIYNAGPVCWVMSTVGVYTNGTTVPDDGGAIQQWMDQSGANNHLGRSLLSQRPLYSTSTNTLNGYPSIWLRGKASFTNGAWASSIKPPYEYFAVIKIFTYFANGYVWSGTGSSAYPGLFCDDIGRFFTGANDSKGQQDNSWFVVSGTGISNAPSVMNTNSYLYLNAVRVIASHNPLAGVDSTRLSVGGLDLVGGNLWGSMEEFIFFNKFLNEHQRIGIELYLKQKYAMPQPF